MLIVSVIILILSLIFFLIRQFDPLSKFEPISDEEIIVLTTVDEEFYFDVLQYIRTLVMTPALQSYLADKKDALEAISYYILLKEAKNEKEKKEQWERERLETVAQPKNHIEKMILQKIKKF